MRISFIEIDPELANSFLDSAERGDYIKVVEMLNTGMLVDVCDEYGITALMQAAENNQLTSLVSCCTRERTLINEIVLIGQLYTGLHSLTRLTSLKCYWSMVLQQTSRIISVALHLILHVSTTKKIRFIYWNNFK